MFSLRLIMWPVVFVGSHWATTTADDRFSNEVLPALIQSCTACHNTKKAEAGLNLESFSALSAGGDSGQAIIAGDPDNSLMLQRILDVDDPMPPLDNDIGAPALNENQITAIRQWITEGATAAAENGTAMDWEVIAPSLQPINAIGVSLDGHWTAVGKSNVVSIIDSLGNQQQLNDPAVQEILNHQSAELVSGTHLDIVQSLAFAPNSPIVATGGFRSLKLWQLNRHPDSIVDLEIVNSGEGNRLTTFSPDRKFVAWVSNEKTIELTDLAKKQSHRFLQLHSSPIVSLDWMEKQLVSVDAAGKLKLLRLTDLQTSTVQNEFDFQLASVLCIDNERILAIDTDKRLIALHLDLTNLKVSLLGVLLEKVQRIIKSQDQQWIVAQREDGSSCVIDSSELKVQHQLPTGAVNNLAIDNTGQTLATIQDGITTVWKTSDGSQLAKLDLDAEWLRLAETAKRNRERQQARVDRLNGQKPGLVNALAAEENAIKAIVEARDKSVQEVAAKQAEVDGANTAVVESQKLVAAAEAAVAEAMKQLEMQKVNLENQQKTQITTIENLAKANAELAKKEQALAAATDSKNLAADRIPQLDAVIAEESAYLEKLSNAADHINTQAQQSIRSRQVLFTQQGLIQSDESGVIRLYDLNGRPLQKFSVSDSDDAISIEALSVDESSRTLQWITNGHVQTCPLTPTWNLLRSIGNFDDSPFSDRVTAIDYSPDGKTIAVGSGPPSRFGEIKLVDAESGAVTLDLGEIHSDTVLGIQFSPDGKYLASVGADKICRVYDLWHSQWLPPLEGHTHHVLDVAWRDDGKTLVTASADNSVKVWDVENNLQLRTITGFSKEVTSVQFVGQTNQFIAASASGQVKLIDCDSGGTIRDFNASDAAVLDQTLTADGSRVLAGTLKGQVDSWNVSDGTKIAAPLLQTSK